MIRREDHEEGVAVLRMEHGKANAIDLELASELVARLDALREGRPSPAVVLTGSGSIFSAGVDLFRILEEDDAYLDAFFEAFGRALVALATHPRPVVAALNGHAVAGGCILACACDRRLMAEGTGTIGVPELSVGIPFPEIALRIMRAAVPPARVRDLVYGGRTLDPDDALAAGLVDEVVPAERLPARAREVAGRLGAVPRETFALTKRQLWKPFLGHPEAASGGRDAAALRLWKAPESREAIRTYLERTLGRATREP